MGPLLVCLAICAGTIARDLAGLRPHARVLLGRPHLVGRARGLRLGVRGGGGVRRATRAHGRARDGVGHPPDLQFRTQGRLPPGRRGLPVGGAARSDVPPAVRALQPAVHLDLPERADPAVLPARVHGLRSRTAHRSACGTSCSPWSSSPSSPARPSPTSSNGRSTGGRRPSGRRVAPPQPGFLQTGLFRVSRHPNFFFEQAQWWVFYGFAVAATGVWLHWTIAGAVLLSALFVGSTVFTESISRAKYPDYDDYRMRTSPIVPWFPRSPRARTDERTA